MAAAVYAGLVPCYCPGTPQLHACGKAVYFCYPCKLHMVLALCSLNQ